MNNSSYAETENFTVWTQTERRILNAVYVIVSSSSVLANFLICYLVFFKKVRRSPFNLLLSNLSVSDLTAALSLYPYIFIELKGINANQTTRDLICSFTIGLTPFFICSSVTMISMTLISVHRYISIRYPLRWAWHIGPKGVKITVGITWTLSIVILLPNFYSFRHDNEEGICYRSWPIGFDGAIYTVATFVFGLIVPLLTFVFCFCSTLKILRTQVADISLSANHIPRSRRKAVRLLGALVGTYLLCWGPFFTFWLLSRSTNKFSSDRQGNYARMRVIRVVILFAALNTFLDPILYGLMSDDFKRGLQQLVGVRVDSALKKTKSQHTETLNITRNRALTNISLPSPSGECWQALKEEAAEKSQREHSSSS